jgi:hypothetical protein
MRYGKPIKNKKHKDPRYFLNENLGIPDDPMEALKMACTSLGKELVKAVVNNVIDNPDQVPAIVEQMVGDKLSELGMPVAAIIDYVEQSGVLEHIKNTPDMLKGMLKTAAAKMLDAACMAAGTDRPAGPGGTPGIIP